MKYYLTKYWFFIGMAGVIILAFGFPGLGDAFKQWHVLNIAIFVAFLITGLTLQSRAVIDEIRNFKALAAALVSCFVLFPLAAFVLARTCFAGNADIIVGACILGVAPATIASGTVLTQMARGNVSLSLFICVATNLVSIFTIPFSLKILLGFEQQIELPVLEMMLKLFLVALVPTIIGQVLRIRLKDTIMAWRKGFSIFSQCVVLLIICNAVARSADRMGQMGATIALVFMFAIVLHTIMLLVNFGISKLIRLNRPSSIALTIHVSQKTLTVSSIVWDNYFAQFSMGLIPVIAHHLTQLVMDTVLAQRFRKAQQVGPGETAEGSSLADGSGKR